MMISMDYLKDDWMGQCSVKGKVNMLNIENLPTGLLYTPRKHAAILIAIFLVKCKRMPWWCNFIF
eukprot:scaffold37349_cov35-Attheya_sp.AAC.5